MSALLFIMCLLMAILLIAVRTGNKRGTDLLGLLAVDVSNYFKIIDKSK